MAFWYGKPDKETYREFAAINFLKNLVHAANAHFGLSEKDNARLKAASDMLETQGYKIEHCVMVELMKKADVCIIEKTVIDILDTDERLVIQHPISFVRKAYHECFKHPMQRKAELNKVFGITIRESNILYGDTDSIIIKGGDNT